MSELTIQCPKCNAEIKLTESLAAPLVASMRADYESKLKAKDADVEKRQTDLRIREEDLAKAKASLEDVVAAKLRQERGKIAEEEAKRAKLAFEDELAKAAREKADLQAVMEADKKKLAEAQQAQAEMLKTKRELEDARRELDLTVQKKVEDELAGARSKARQEAEEELKGKVQEREQTIASMQKQIEDLRRKAEQGSQQLQGEVLELEIETTLGANFPFDKIEPISKGERGADVLQCVRDQTGRACGAILWESKRTKNWSDGWLAKLRDDQRDAKAEISVLVSQVLPKDVESFGLKDGVWVTHPRHAVPIAAMLRASLVEIARARQSVQGQQTKTEMIYEYLTGPQFRQRVEAIVEAFSSMQADLDKERKVIQKQWAKREAQIKRVIEGTTGMVGDLQGIAGQSIQEIEGLEMKALGDGEAKAEAEPEADD